MAPWQIAVLGMIAGLSEAEWNAIMETLHLLRSPANAAALMESIADLDAGRGVRREYPRAVKRIEQLETLLRRHDIAIPEDLDDTD